MIVIYIGDELTAAGFRLAGAQILLPAAGEEAASLARAQGDAQLVLLSADVAARIPRESLGAALAEKPELFGRLLIFVGLAEGIAIYGLIISILILNRL